MQISQGMVMKLTVIWWNDVDVEEGVIQRKTQKFNTSLEDLNWRQIQH